MKKFNEFANESILDKMTPASIDNISKKLTVLNNYTVYKDTFGDSPLGEQLDILIKEIDSEYGQFKYYDDEYESLSELYDYLSTIIMKNSGSLDNYDELEINDGEFDIFKEEKIIFGTTFNGISDVIIFDTERLKKILENEKI